MAEKKYILAHDTGTGGDKAVLTDLRGVVIHSAYQDYGLYYPKPDWVEQDPDELWQTVAATTRKVIQESGVDPAEILGVDRWQFMDFMAAYQVPVSTLTSSELAAELKHLRRRSQRS